MKDIKKLLCESMYSFVKSHINEVTEKKDIFGRPQTFESLGFKDAKDMLRQIKTDADIAYWALTELLAWGMDEDYCSKLFVADNDVDGCHTIYTIYGRYFRYANNDIIEVMPKIKLIEVKVWEDKDVKEELPF